MFPFSPSSKGTFYTSNGILFSSSLSNTSDGKSVFVVPCIEIKSFSYFLTKFSLFLFFTEIPDYTTFPLILNKFPLPVLLVFTIYCVLLSIIYYILLLLSIIHYNPCFPLFKPKCLYFPPPCPSASGYC